MQLQSKLSESYLKARGLVSVNSVLSMLMQLRKLMEYFFPLETQNLLYISELILVQVFALISAIVFMAVVESRRQFDPYRYYPL